MKIQTTQDIHVTKTIKATVNTSQSNNNNTAHSKPCSCALKQIRVGSQLLEMWQVRKTLDMQASALWLISTTQLCRATSAWLVLKKVFLIFLSFTQFPSMLSQIGSLRLLLGSLHFVFRFGKEEYIIFKCIIINETDNAPQKPSPAILHDFKLYFVIRKLRQLGLKT